MYPYSVSLTNLLELFSYPLYVRDYYRDVIVVVGGGGVVVSVGRVVCMMGFLVVVMFPFKFLL